MPAIPPQPPSYPPQFEPARPSSALTALILSIVGLVACQALSPVSWYLANKELDLIDQGVNDPTKRDQANAAKIVGIIGTVLLAIGLLVLVAVIVIFAIGIGAAAN